MEARVSMGSSAKREDLTFLCFLSMQFWDANIRAELELLGSPGLVANCWLNQLARHRFSQCIFLISFLTINNCARRKNHYPSPFISSGTCFPSWIISMTAALSSCRSFPLNPCLMKSILGWVGGGNTPCTFNLRGFSATV